MTNAPSFTEAMRGHAEHGRLVPRAATRSDQERGARRPLRAAARSSGVQRAWHLGPLLLLACATLACPQLMEDDFGVADAGLAGAGSEGGSAGWPMGGSNGWVWNSGGRGGASGSAGSGGSSGSSGGSGAGSGGGGGDCTGASFSPPTLVELDLDGNLSGPALSNDGLTLYFALETSSAGLDLYRATRADDSSEFSSPLPVSELNTLWSEGTPYVTPYGVLYFSSNRSGETDIWRALNDPSGAFAIPERMSDLSSTLSDGFPCPSQDGLRLLLASERPGSAGGSDLWLATRATAVAAYTTIVPISELNTSDQDLGASSTGDDLGIYFTSDRAGGAGDLDIWYSSRFNVWSGFSPPINVASVNGPGEDGDVHVSRDGRELFFASTRSGERRIWRAERACP